MSNTKKNVASRCLSAWTRGDFATTRSLLHEDVTFEGPLGQTVGADAYIKGIQRMSEMVQKVDQHAILADDDDVCIIYDLVTNHPAARIPTAGWYRVQDGKILSVRAFFDPRPLVGSP